MYMYISILRRSISEQLHYAGPKIRLLLEMVAISQPSCGFVLM